MLLRVCCFLGLLLVCPDILSALDIAPPPVNEEKVKEPEKYDVTIHFKLNGKEVPVYVSIYDEKGKNVICPIKGLRFIADKKATFRLARGKYQVVVMAGPRVTVWKGVLDVTDNDMDKEITLEDFFAINKNEWLTFSTNVRNHPVYLPQFYLDSILLKMAAGGVNIASLTSSPIVNENSFQDKTVIEKSLNRILHSSFFYDDVLGITSSDNVIQIPETMSLDESVVHMYKNRNNFNYWATKDPDGDLFYLIATGAGIDGIDIGYSKLNQEIWQVLLSLGLKVVAVSSKPDSGELDNTYPAVNMYLKNDFISDRASAVRALKAGKSIVTNGPFVTFNVDGKSPGDTLYASDITREITVTAYSSSAHTDSIKNVDIIYNGKVLESFRGIPSQRSMTAGYNTKLFKKGWLIVRYRSKDEKYWAATNPVFIESEDNGQFFKKTTAVFINAVSGDIPQSCIMEAWDRGMMLGRFSVPDSGKKIELPSGSIVKVFDIKGQQVSEFTLFKASGAEAYVKSLAQDKTKLAKALTSKGEYLNVSRILESAKICVDIGEQ